MPKYTSPAVAKAVYTLDLVGMPVRPEEVAAALQQLLSDLVSQGYEVLGVHPMAGALLCTAVKRPGVSATASARPAMTTYEWRGVAVSSPEPVHYYGCEGDSCLPGAHTLDCPHLNKP